MATALGEPCEDSFLEEPNHPFGMTLADAI